MKQATICLALAAMVSSSSALEIDSRTNGVLPYITEHPCTGEPSDESGCHLRVNPHTGNYAPLTQEEALVQATKLCRELGLPGVKWLTVHFQPSGGLAYTCRVGYEEIAKWWRTRVPKKTITLE